MELPALSPDYNHYYLALLILISGQLIYATVGFGAGMFAITLLVMLLGNTPGVVMMMLMVTWITEVLVLAREWPNARGRLLLVMIPPMMIGAFLGDWFLKKQKSEVLEFYLGVVVAAAGAWFIIQDIQRTRALAVKEESQPKPISLWRGAIATPFCFASGFLGAVFGTGGPPVIVYLKSFHFPKRNFRATILSFFFSMSITRVSFASWSGNLQMAHIKAALWMLPASVIGTLVGAKVYKRLSERVFARVVSVIIFILGIVLIVKAWD